jgi:glycosyltransferase involved in cell wall biosynthesis
MTKISIITPIKNNDDYSLLYNSIKKFLCPSLIWIIKCSDQCTPDYLNKIPKSQFIKVILSHDNSYPQAVNQAIVEINSDYYFLLGASDYLIENNFQLALQEINNNPSKDAYLFSCLIIESQKVFHPNLANLFIKMPCPNPSSILSVKNVLILDGMNENYRIASDYDLLCRYFIEFKNIYTSKTILTAFSPGGISSLNPLESMLEEELIRIRIFKSQPIAVLSRLLSYATPHITRLIAKNFK